jgi:hypothetical protein
VRIADAVQNVSALRPEFNINLPARCDASRYRGDMESKADLLARGVMRLFDELGHVSVAEFTLPNGRRADVATLGRDGELSIVEIKCSVADFKADEKWPEYLEWCDRFFSLRYRTISRESFYPQNMVSSSPTDTAGTSCEALIRGN